MRQKSKTSMLTSMALLATVSLVLTRFLSFYIPFMGTQSMRVGFGDVPIILAGLLLSPYAGGLVGLVADIAGATLFPSGPFFPGFTVTAFLVGFLPAFLLNRFKKKEQGLTKAKLFLAILCTQLVGSALLNTLWIVILYMSPATADKYWALFVVRAPFSLMMSVLYTIIVYPLYIRIFKENL